MILFKIPDTQRTSLLPNGTWKCARPYQPKQLVAARHTPPDFRLRRGWRTASLLPAVVIGLLAVAPSPALAFDVLWNQSIDNNYANPDNWQTGFRPAFFLNEVGVIGNTAVPNGAANVTSVVLDQPAGIVLGKNPGTIGTLNIHSGGMLTVKPGSQTTGNVDIGNSGVGILNVSSGGVLVAQSLALGGANGSQLQLDGTAILNITDDVQLNNLTRMTGSSVDFTLGGDLNFDGGSTLVAEITGTSHSAFHVQGHTTIGGTLQVQFDGFNPTVGDAWNLVDATSISGNFTSITSPGFPLEGSQQFVVRTVADASSVYGRVVRLMLEEFQSILELRVDPTTGHAILFNSSDLDAVAIEGYDIFSPSGSLLPADGSWDSLDDQNAAGGDWRESNVSQSRLAELKQAGATTVGIDAGDVFDLGIPFDAAAGSQDLQFSFLRSGEAFPSPGVVTYQAFALPGDYNDDGSVDAADYTVWRDSFGQHVALPNESLTAGTPGVVDQEDYDLWAQRFGDSNSNNFQLAHHSVPEPSSSWTLLLYTLVPATVARRSLRHHEDGITTS